MGLGDVPVRPLRGRSDLPILPSRPPRFIPRDELDRLMTAIEESRTLPAPRVPASATSTRAA